MNDDRRRARDRIVIALDFATVGDARDLISELGDHAGYFKIGHQLAFAGGLSLIDELKAAGKGVFLDMKLLDIDNTVAGGVRSIAALNVDMLTIHAYPKAMMAAVKAKQESNASMDLLGVTVLTSMDDEDLHEAGYRHTANELVEKRASHAISAGMDGLVCSPLEVAHLRKLLGNTMKLVVPGIRPSGSDYGDQKRVMTPGEAVQAGADYLVIGRPITKAMDPRKAQQAVIEELVSAG